MENVQNMYWTKKGDYTFNVLHIEEYKKADDSYQIGDGGPIWLETEKDYENVANNIIELEKLYLKIN